MDMEQLNALSPFVRAVKIAKAKSLTGEWLDYDHVFTYIEQGEASFVLNGVAYSVAEGDVVLMPPYMPHIIRSVSEVPLIQYIFHFDCQFSVQRSLWTKLGSGGSSGREIPVCERLFEGSSPIAHIRKGERIKLKKIFLHMHKEFSEQRAAHSLVLKAGALELIALFLRNLNELAATRTPASNGWPIIEKCITIMQEHYADASLGNKMISQHAGISTSHMTYLFQKELGVTVHKYLTHVRIQQAKHKMLENKESMTQVAEQTGFSSIHHFSRTFKAMAGMTASQFLAAHQPAKPASTKEKGDPNDEQ